MSYACNSAICVVLDKMPSSSFVAIVSFSSNLLWCDKGYGHFTLVPIPKKQKKIEQELRDPTFVNVSGHSDFSSFMVRTQE